MIDDDRQPKIVDMPHGYISKRKLLPTADIPEIVERMNFMAETIADLVVKCNALEKKVSLANGGEGYNLTLKGARMYTLRRRFTFEASHKLPREGKSGRLHGHSWIAWIVLEAEKIRDGMILDAELIDCILQPFIDHYLDGHNLNDSTALRNPTPEAIAEWMYWQLQPRFQNAGAFLREVLLEEGFDCQSVFRPPEAAIKRGAAPMNGRKGRPSAFLNAG